MPEGCFCEIERGRESELCTIDVNLDIVPPVCGYNNSLVDVEFSPGFLFNDSSTSRLLSIFDGPGSWVAIWLYERLAKFKRLNDEVDGIFWIEGVIVN